MNRKKPATWTRNRDMKIPIPIYPGIGEHSERALILPAYKVLIDKISFKRNWVWCEQCNGFHLTDGDITIDGSDLAKVDQKLTFNKANLTPGFTDRANRLT